MVLSRWRQTGWRSRAGSPAPPLLSPGGHLLFPGLHPQWERVAIDWGTPRCGSQDGAPKGGGEELGARAAAEEGTGTFSERGEGARHLFASPADFLGCGLCCLCTKLFLNTMMCVGCRTLSKAGLLCPGSSISSRCSTAHLKLSVAPVQPKTQNLLIVFCADV